MSKSVLISIRPEWCEKIASGEKTIEARKTYPKLETPFKCYIYCTKTGLVSKSTKNETLIPVESFGKVIGEFNCDLVCTILAHPNVFAGKPLYFQKAMDDACLTEKDVDEYSGGKDVFGLCISDLKIYDKPMPLSEFYKPGTLSNEDFLNELYDGSGDPMRSSYASYLFARQIRRQPQSWCYVEELNK